MKIMGSAGDPRLLESGCSRLPSRGPVPTPLELNDSVTNDELRRPSAQPTRCVPWSMCIVASVVCCAVLVGGLLGRTPPATLWVRPPYGQATKQADAPRKTPLDAKYTYERKTAFLAAGGDLDTGKFAVEEAQAHCTGLIRCMGFTFRTEPSLGGFPASVGSDKFNVYFKSHANAVPDSDWVAYLKQSDPEIPDTNFTIGGFNVELRSNSHTVQRMRLEVDDMPPYNFSFVPPLKGPGRPNRSLPRCHQLGDVTVRVRPSAAPRATDPPSIWAMYGSAGAGADKEASSVSPWGSHVIVAHDITDLMEGETDPQPFSLGLRVVRSYERSSGLGQEGLVMRWNITNISGERQTLGGLGFTLPADSFTAGLQLDDIAYTNSFVDPHIGGQHGFAEWVRVAGNRSMLVVPHSDNAGLEAWRPVLEDCLFDGGMSEWTVLSAAWAEEWELNQQAPVWTMEAKLIETGVWPDPKSPWPSWHGKETLRVENIHHWNPPTSLDLEPGEEVSYALRFVLAARGPRSRDRDLSDVGKVALHAVPGYTIATDMDGAALLALLPTGTNQTVLKVSSEPLGVLEVGNVQNKGEYVEIGLRGLRRGRARVVVHLSDGTSAIAHYYVLPPFAQQVERLGAHWSTVAWLPREFPDPFGRSASVMPWDREDNCHHLEDSRAYIVGLSDDAGAANNLGLATKVNFAPVQSEVGRVDEYIQWTLYGVKPDVAKPPLKSLQDPATDGIRMTMYFYPNPADRSLLEEGTAVKFQSSAGQVLLGVLPAAQGLVAAPTKLSGTTAAFGVEGMPFDHNFTEADKCGMPVSGPIWCMTENMSNMTYRGYNNPHQTAVYWAMYRIARFYDRMETIRPWHWYLERAWMTMKVIGSASVGLMDGTVFREVLLALQEEGASNQTFAVFAEEAERNMKVRADQWALQAFPYGSEFNFDTTGQEEVYVWLSYFNYTEPAKRTLEAVLGYMRSLPNWAWDGGSRSMGDLGNNGKWFVNRGVERGLMHYRAGLNMIPLAEAYRSNPDDHLLLEISMGAISGQMANIDESGATSMMFHSFPFVNEFDPNSGDYGLGFFGHSLETGGYFVRHPIFGPRCYLCNLRFTPDKSSESVEIFPRDSYRKRVFLEPLGLYIVARTGIINSILLDLSEQSVRVLLASGRSGASPVEGQACPPFSQFVVEVCPANEMLMLLSAGAFGMHSFVSTRHY